MQKKIIILCLIFSSFSAKAQTNLDSLFSVWQDELQPDSARSDAFAEYIWLGFLFSQPDSAFTLASQLVDFSQEKKYPEGEASGLNLKGISKTMTGNYNKALVYHHQSLKITEEIGDKPGTARTLINIGNIYNSKGDYVKSLTLFQQSLKLQETIGNKNNILVTLNNIGTLYESQSNYQKALTYYEKSLKISEEISHKPGIASGLNNIGLIYKYQGNTAKALEYFDRSLRIREVDGDKRGISISLNNLGSTYNSAGNYDKALQYYQQSLEIREEIGDKKGIASCLNNIGDNYSFQGNSEKALEYHERSLKIREELGDKLGITASFSSIGKTFKDQGNYAKALIYCQQGLQVADSIGSLANQKTACLCIYNAYKATDNSSKALIYLEKVNIIDDSLNKQEISEKLQKMEFSKQVFTDSVKQAEKDLIVLLKHKEEVRKKNQTRNMFGIIGLITLMIAGGIYSRLRYTRKSKAELQVEKDRSENLLLNILPADIAKELKEKGRAEARGFDIVSILFTDFKGFTAASEKLTAHDLVKEINACFEAFDGIIGKYNIEKIKTIGDAYMAAGGLPLPTDDSVKNTLLAALEMQVFIAKRKFENDAAGKAAFEMRVGIHTGPVVAGIVGVKKFQYDIWGDTVNTASRMESSGEVGKVNISQSTYELLKDDTQFKFESRGKVEAKGKGKIEMYFAQLSS